MGFELQMLSVLNLKSVAALLCIIKIQ